MLGTVSSPIAQRAAAKRAAEARRREPDTKKVHNHASLPWRGAHGAAARLLCATAHVEAN